MNAISLALVSSTCMPTWRRTCPSELEVLDPATFPGTFPLLPPLRVLQRRRWGLDRLLYMFVFFYRWIVKTEGKNSQRDLWVKVCSMREYIKTKWEIHGSSVFEGLIFNSLFSLIITTIMHWLFKKGAFCWLIPLPLISIDSATAAGD